MVKNLFSIKKTTKIDFFLKAILLKFLIFFNKKSKSDIKVFYNKDFISQIISINGTFEEESLYLITSFLKKNFNLRKKNILDIGGNIGNHSIYFSKYFRKVYSFEPHPTNFLINKLNTKNFKNIHTFNLAIGEKKKRSYIYENSESMGGHSFLKNTIKNKVKKKYPVKMVTLDNLINKFNNAFVMKLDVERYELQVIKGGLKFINKFRPIILFENHKNEKNVINLLIKNDYKICYIKPSIEFKSFFLKRLINLRDYLFGKDMKIIYESNNIPNVAHGNLIAIPKENSKFKNLWKI